MLRSLVRLQGFGGFRSVPVRSIVIGVPKETKPDEFRVGMTPSGADILVKKGHTVLIENDAGIGSAIPNQRYIDIVPTAKDAWNCDMVMKVKEPLEHEYGFINNQVLFTYFHYGANRKLTEAMLENNSVSIAYETVQLTNGSTPLLIPMSEVAGRMAVQEGAKYLERPFEGLGKLLSGVPGVPPGNVTIIGAGVVGTQAAKIAAGLGANVTILDTNMQRLRYLSDVMPNNVVTLFSTPYNLFKAVSQADLVIGAILIIGETAPMLFKREDLKYFKERAVFIDVSIDQGGISETSRATTHSNPTYQVDGVNHYCVGNIPGAVPATSTYALTNVTMRYAEMLADNGWKTAVRMCPELKLGVNKVGDALTHVGVAKSFQDLPFADLDNFLD